MIEMLRTTVYWIVFCFKIPVFCHRKIKFTEIFRTAKAGKSGSVFPAGKSLYFVIEKLNLQKFFHTATFKLIPTLLPIFITAEINFLFSST